jgi:hypothetical protein
MWKNGNQRTLGTHNIYEKPQRPVMFTGKKLVVFWANIWLNWKLLLAYISELGICFFLFDICRCVSESSILFVGSAHREELTHLCWIWDRILAQPWTTVWVTCRHSSAHIRWVGSFHHASRWKIWHPILKVFGLTWNSPYKAESCRDELLGENWLINPKNSLDTQGGFGATAQHWFKFEPWTSSLFGDYVTQHPLVHHQLETS